MLFPTPQFVLFFLLFLFCYLFWQKDEKYSPSDTIHSLTEPSKVVWHHLPNVQKRIWLISLFNTIFYCIFSIKMFTWLLVWSFALWLGAKKVKSSGLIVILGVLQVAFWKMYEAHWFGSTLEGWKMPLGISFFTFQGLSYIFAIQKKPVHKTELHIEEAWGFLKVFAFTGFFPTVFSGPILRAKLWEEELKKDFIVNYQRLHSGLALIALGCLYKLCFSSYLHDIVSRAFSAPSEENWLVLWAGMYSYSLEIFHDFAGYSLMSLGIAKLFGFDLPANFNRPYFTYNLKDFWTKWHISLSTWFRDYLYFPLGGNKVIKSRQVFNIACVMTVSGLWHGLASNYLVWGAMHTVGIVAFHLFAEKVKIPKIISWIFTIHYVFFAWIFFRSPDASFALSYIYNMFDLQKNNISDLSILVWLFFGLCMIVQFIEPKILSFVEKFKFVQENMIGLIAFWSIIFILILALSPSGMPPFIYFQY